MEKINIDEIAEDVNIINSNIEHFSGALEFLCFYKGKIPVTMKANSGNGRILDRGYAGNGAIIMSDLKKRINIETIGAFSERARENISTTCRIFMEKYL